MKRGTLVAIVILVVLIAVYFLTRRESVTDVDTPFTIQKVEGLQRIELTRPSESGAKLVVLEKREAGWWLTKPLEAPLDARAASEITNALSKQIGTDDLRLSKQRLADYDLGPDKAVQVALFPAGKSEPAISFTLGRELIVEQTRVRQSYIATSKGRPLRLRTSLEVFRKPVNGLRSKNIITPGESGVTTIQITKGKDEAGALRLVREGKVWTLNESDWPLEVPVVNAIAGSMTSLIAAEFVDDKAAATLGLEPPHFTVKALRGSTETTIYVGRVGDEYFVKSPSNPQIYKIAPAVGLNLSADLLHVRERVVRKMDRQAISAIHFLGGIQIRKNGESWELVEPSKGPADSKKVMGRLGGITNLRASGFVSDEAGLQAMQNPSRVVVTESGVERVLLIGSPVENTKHRYAKWADLDLFFVLPDFAIVRLSPKLEDLTKS